MSKHTPGPWLVQNEHDGTFSIWTRQPHTGTLATVFNEDINGEYPAEANARLMHAAPELLSWMETAVTALKAASCFLAENGNADGSIIIDNIVDDCVSAISKARGE